MQAAPSGRPKALARLAASKAAVCHSVRAVTVAQRRSRATRRRSSGGSAVWKSSTTSAAKTAAATGLPVLKGYKEGTVSARRGSILENERSKDVASHSVAVVQGMSRVFRYVSSGMHY